MLTHEIEIASQAFPVQQKNTFNLQSGNKQQQQQKTVGIRRERKKIKWYHFIQPN